VNTNELDSKFNDLVHANECYGHLLIKVSEGYGHLLIKVTEGYGH
jgi:hypothetical protein